MGLLQDLLIIMVIGCKINIKKASLKGESLKMPRPVDNSKSNNEETINGMCIYSGIPTLLIIFGCECTPD